MLPINAKDNEWIFNPLLQHVANVVGSRYSSVSCVVMDRKNNFYSLFLSTIFSQCMFILWRLQHK